MGRPGTAFSLVLREELPYLMDLHLYLGRAVVPAPEAPDAAAVAAAREAGFGLGPDGEFFCGRVRFAVSELCFALCTAAVG